MKTNNIDWYDLSALNKLNNRCYAVVSDYYELTGKSPKYLILSKPIHDQMINRYNLIYGLNDDYIEKFITSFGELDVIVLDIPEEYIKVG